MQNVIGWEWAGLDKSNPPFNWFGLWRSYSYLNLILIQNSLVDRHKKYSKTFI